MTLCLILRTIEGIAVATDTSTTSIQTNSKGEKIRYYTYYRKKINHLKNWVVVHTGTTFINQKAVWQILDEIENIEEDWKDFIHQIEELIKTELNPDIARSFKRGDPHIPDSLLLTLGLVGYNSNQPVYITIDFRVAADLKSCVVNITDYTSKNKYGIAFLGDFEFPKLLLDTAIKRNLLKQFEILTLKEAHRFTKILLQFQIDFQKFMVQKTVDEPIESLVITRKNGVHWIDRMDI